MITITRDVGSKEMTFVNDLGEKPFLARLDGEGGPMHFETDISTEDRKRLRKLAYKKHLRQFQAQESNGDVPSQESVILSRDDARKKPIKSKILEAKEAQEKKLGKKPGKKSSKKSKAS